MSALAIPTSPIDAAEQESSGSYIPSPAGPADGATPTPRPPTYELSPRAQGIRFTARPMSFVIGAHRRFGDVWRMRLPLRTRGFVLTCHPDHIASLMKANPADAPSLTGESPLRPIIGPGSVLTAVGDRHLRQRKLLLPPFHGEAIQRYVQKISDVADAEIDAWPVHRPFALAPRMQAVTLAVIMSAVFGIEGDADRRTPEIRLRDSLRRFLGVSTTPLYRAVELRNAGRHEPLQPLRAMLAGIDRPLYEVIARRRAAERVGDSAHADVLSLLLRVRDESGEPLTDREIRDELMTLLLAGHETTANSLAWAFERLLRTPAAYDRLREELRSGDTERSAAYVEATIHETMRSRPVIPMVVRQVKRPWRFGEYVLAADTPVSVSILGLHHRDDIYPRPQDFRPQRFVGIKPGTYTWMPFGGGIRRCLGATLAMAEQRVVLEAIARRTDLVAPDPRPEAPRLRNVTMIPVRGSIVELAARRPG